jgi:hypothetical protein
MHARHHHHFNIGVFVVVTTAVVDYIVAGAQHPSCDDWQYQG